MEPLGNDDKPLGPVPYVRSGLLGFLGPVICFLKIKLMDHFYISIKFSLQFTKFKFQNGLIFVVGNRNSQMYVSGRQHGADDLIATALAVEPMKFIYRGLLFGIIAIFNMNLKLTQVFLMSFSCS